MTFTNVTALTHNGDVWLIEFANGARMATYVCDDPYVTACVTADERGTATVSIHPSQNTNEA